jgi:hypothetical protein
LCTESFVSCLLSKNIKIKIYETIIVPVVLYHCECRSLALRGEHKLRVFENKLLRRIFGTKWETRTRRPDKTIMRSLKYD